MHEPSRIPYVCSAIERGWPVFPCDKRKQPKVRHWKSDASLDVQLMRDHWVTNQDDCIGIVCGLASNLIVVDVDSYKDPDRAQLFRILCAEKGLPSTYSVTTGSGGTHLYFRPPPGVMMGNVTRFSDQYCVDIRGEGGYVIGAGSEIPQGRYVVKNDAPVAEMPMWLVDMLLAKPEADPLEPEDTTEFSDDERRANDATAVAYLRKIVADELEPCIAHRIDGDAWLEPGRYQGPGWDISVYRAACSLLTLVQSRWNNLTERDAFDTLMRSSPRDAGFTDTQILEKWNSARKKVAGKVKPPPRNHRGERVSFDPESFFGKGGLLVDVLLDALMHETWQQPYAVDDTELHSVWVYRHGVWTLDSNAVLYRVIHLLGDRYRPAHFAGIIDPLKRRLLEAGSTISCAPVEDYLNLQNGMLAWRSGELLPHDPDYRSTIRLPLEYRPDAVCPAFDRFVESVMPSDAIEYLWEVMGYMLMSGNPLQKAILLYGDGSNGKGTLIRVMEAMLGSANCSSATLQDMTEGKFSTSSLYGKIANLAGDIDPTYMRSSAMFKAITGDDMVEAQRKFEHAFRFKCWAVPVFSANKLWRSVDTSTGYRRRWVIVHFPNTFDMTPNLTPSLTTAAERDGILAHAVCSLRTLMARGRFELPLSAQLATGAFETATDQVLEWLAESEEIVESKPGTEEMWTPSSLVYASYKRWASESGVGQVSAPEFRARLQAAGYIVRKSNVTRVYGLKIDALASQSASW